jgi:hypothetical protein
MGSVLNEGLLLRIMKAESVLNEEIEIRTVC